MLPPEGDANYSDAAEDAENGVNSSNLPPSGNNPQHVENKRQTARASLPVDHLAAKRPQSERAELEKLQAERDSDNGNAEKQSDKEIDNRHQKPAQDEPKQVSNRFHDKALFSAAKIYGKIISANRLPEKEANLRKQTPHGLHSEKQHAEALYTTLRHVLYEVPSRIELL